MSLGCLGCLVRMRALCGLKASAVVRLILLHHTQVPKVSEAK